MFEKNNLLFFEDLANDDNIIHFFSKKPFNFSKKNINSKIIMENYTNIMNNLNFSFDYVRDCVQKHTSNIVILNDSNKNDTSFDNADGIITNLKNIPIVTYYADCQPILIYDPIKKVVGNIHSGWRGTTKKIIVNAINIMKNEFNCNVLDIKVYIGPCIHKCCFEVDEDVFDIFRENFNNINKFTKIVKKNNDKSKYYIDTVGINISLLRNLGILDENIFYSNICTKCNYKDIYSYRAEPFNNGRNIAFICLK